MPIAGSDAIRSSIKFSVIIPCYNCSSTITDTLDSVVSQCGDDVEIVCVNDCSTDNTLSILNDVAERFSCVRVYSLSANSGVSSARNLGIRESKGQYLLFLDADDEYLPGIFSELGSIVTLNHGVDLISYGFNRDGGSGKSQRLYKSGFIRGLNSSANFLAEFLRRSVFQHVCSFAIKRDVVINNGISFNTSVSLGEDIVFQIKCMSSSREIYYTDSVYFNYKFNEQSVSNSRYKFKHLSCLKNYKDAYNFVKSSCSDVDLRLLNFYFQYLYFYELKKFLRSDRDILDQYLSDDFVLAEKTPIFMSKSSLILYSLKSLYRFFPKILFHILSR